MERVLENRSITVATAVAPNILGRSREEKKRSRPSERLEEEGGDRAKWEENREKQEHANRFIYILKTICRS